MSQKFNTELGLRFNKNKRRIDLVPKELTDAVADVFGYGANKYTTYNEDGSLKSSGDNNWMKGLPWMDVYASTQRHLDEWVKGKDFDEESSLLHLGHAATNIAFLLKFYKIHPELDNRFKMPVRRIGLDIDEVLADFTGGWAKEFGTNPHPKNWAFSYENHDRFKNLTKEQTIRIYSNLKPKISPDDIPFEPACYVTARSVDPEITKKWLEDNGFSTAPVYTVPFKASKVDVIKEADVDIFVDDSYSNFVELNDAGITTYLFDANHNKRYDVGARRIYSLKELV